MKHRRNILAMLVGLGVVLGAAGCRYSARPANGTQRCASGPKRCPDGYTCGADDRCWWQAAPPAGPPAPGDGGPPVVPPPNPGAAAGKSAARLAPGGVQGRSAQFRTTRGVVAPVGGGPQLQRSPRFKFVGGLVGSSVTETQEKK